MKDLTPISKSDVLLAQRIEQKKAGLNPRSRDEAALRDLLGVGHAWGVNEATSINSEQRLQKKQERYQKCLPIAYDILEEARAQLAVRFRFLDHALWRMPLEPSFQLYGLCSDGVKLYYDPEYVVDRFKLSPNEVVRDVSHCLFHCIFRHPFMLYSVLREPWDVSCDIAIECILIDLLGDVFPSNFDGRAKRALKIISSQLGGVVTAERLYHFFSNSGNRADLRSLAPLFRHDSHSLWYADDYDVDGKSVASVTRQETEDREGGVLPTTESMTPEQLQEMSNSMSGGSTNAASTEGEGEQIEPSAEAPEATDDTDDARTEAEEEQSCTDSPENEEEERADNLQDISESAATADAEELAKQWEELSQHIQIELEASIAQRGEGAGNLAVQLKALNRERQNYEAFLKRFSVLRERMMVNDDEFDYIYYRFGMDRYGNMPLIEPLEYKDARGIHDFVIAIDTSESCSGELVQAFMRKTYTILQQSESFHSRVNIHIVQCDARIQSDKKIESLDDLDLFLEQFELRGFGGTDFRPVFEYVNLLCEKGEFSDLRGLVYFTDGQGIFPRKQPKYDTVFVFIDDGYSDPQVPPWALKLLLDERELMVPSAR